MATLALLCQCTGILLIIGSFWLLFKQKIYLDATTKQVMYVELPLIGKMKTNAPSLAIIVLGLIAVIIPFYYSRTRYLSVHQHFTSNSYPISVYAVCNEHSIENDGELHLQVPLLSESTYEPAIVYRVGTITEAESLDLSKAKNGSLQLSGRTISLTDVGPTLRPDVSPKPEAFQ
jgi:hypothetical protein